MGTRHTLTKSQYHPDDYMHIGILEDEKEELLQLLHRWHWLWNEGELTFEPFQYTQEDFDDLVVQTRRKLLPESTP